MFLNCPWVSGTLKAGKFRSAGMGLSFAFLTGSRSCYWGNQSLEKGAQSSEGPHSENN